MMRRLRNALSSFRIQLALGVALVHAVLMVLFVAELVQTQQDFLHERHVQRGLSLTQGMAQQSVTGLLSRDLAATQEIVQGFRTYPEMRYVAIVDPRGKVLAHTDPARVGEYMADAVSTRMLAGRQTAGVLVDDGHVLDVASPVQWQGKVLGWVRFAAGMEGVNAQLRRVILEGIGFAVVAVLVGVALAMWMARRTTRRLYGLMKVAAATSGGDRSARAPADEGSEVGRLAGAFNLMLDTLAANERQLLKSNEDLERRVEQRTAALAKSEEAQRVILAQANDAFVAIGVDGRVTEWNRAATALFGFTAAEAQGRLLTELIIPPKQHDAHARGHASFIHTGEGKVTNRRVEVAARHKDGYEVPVELSVSAIKTPEGFVATAFMRDIRERLMAQDELKKSQGRLQQALESLPALVGYFDRDVRCRYSNRLARQLRGLQAGEEIGLHLRDAIGEQNYALHEPHLPQVLRGERARFEGSMKRDGRDVHFHVHLVPESDTAGKVVGFYVMSFDVTALKEAQLQQERARRQLRAITDNLPVMISYIDAQHRLQFVNRTFHEWTGVATGDALGKDLRDVIGDRLYEQRRAALEQALCGKRVEFEVVSNALGIRRVLHTAYIPDCPRADVTAGVYTLTSDVTALRDAEQRMTELAMTDTLTGLANRRHFEQRLPEALGRAARVRKGCAVMFLDVDYFKRINDSFGHAAGDAVLVTFAQRLAACVRSTDLVARLAGDEFVVVLEGMNDPDECHVIANKVNAAARAPMRYEARNIVMTTSIGIAYLAGGEPCIPEVLLRHADEALYRTKAQGRDGYTVVEVGVPEAQFKTSGFADLI